MFDAGNILVNLSNDPEQAQLKSQEYADSGSRYLAALEILEDLYENTKPETIFEVAKSPATLATQNPEPPK